MKNTPLRRSGPIGRRQPLKPINRARQSARKKITDGPQSQLCRESPCCVPECGWVPWEGHPTHPHHWPTVARQGKDSDTSPLCPDHHRRFHDHGHLAFFDDYHVDVIEEARLLAERIKEDS